MAKSFFTLRTEGVMSTAQADPVTETLSKSDPVEKWVTDFVKSSDERFVGKSKEERIKMALGAYYGAQKNEDENQETAVVNEVGTGPEEIETSDQPTSARDIQKEDFDSADQEESEESSITVIEIDQIADMADDLFYTIGDNQDEPTPAWVQDKISGLHRELSDIYQYYQTKNIVTT